MSKIRPLFTAQELEKILGEKYFYRQSLYRLAESNDINFYLVNTLTIFLKMK